MHDKDKVIFDKKIPYEYNICLYILEELCDKGEIDVFEMTESHNSFKKEIQNTCFKYPCKKDNNSND